MPKLFQEAGKQEISLAAERPANSDESTTLQENGLLERQGVVFTSRLSVRSNMALPLDAQGATPRMGTIPNPTAPNAGQGLRSSLAGPRVSLAHQRRTREAGGTGMDMEAGEGAGGTSEAAEDPRPSVVAPLAGAGAPPRKPSRG